MLSKSYKNVINPNFWFVFEHTETFVFTLTSMASSTADCYNCILSWVYHVYGKYLLFSTLQTVSHVQGLWYLSISEKFWRIFGGG